jgi:hypothetical protein
MSLHLVETLEAALAGLAQEVHKDASVMVQFAAGDWYKIREALGLARAEITAAAPAVEPVAVATSDASQATTGEAATGTAADETETQGADHES